MYAAITLLLLLFSMITAADNIYRWTDAAGQVHFSDAPPSVVAAEVSLHTTSRDRRAGIGQGVRAGEKTLLRDAAKRRKRELSQRGAAHRKWREARAKRSRICARTQQRLAALSSPRYGWEERRKILKQRRALRCFGDR